MANAKHDPAPHGFEEDGVTAKAPFGLNIDGTPRKSNRGARPGQRGNKRGSSAPRARSSSANDARRKESLCGLVDMLVTTPLAAASMSQPVHNKLGNAQADALAGDAVIVEQFMPEVADALIVAAQSKPGLLVWLDRVEDNAPYLLLAQAAVGIGKAVASNHANPNPRLNAAGRTRLAMKAAQMAETIEQQATALGVPLQPQMRVVDPSEMEGESNGGQSQAS